MSDLSQDNGWATAPDGESPLPVEPLWAPDPTGRHQWRYRDEQAWTDHVSDDRHQSPDPFHPNQASALENQKITKICIGETKTVKLAEDAIFLTNQDQLTRRISLGAISDVTLKKATPFSIGWLQVGLGGVPLRTLDSSDARSDPNTVVFLFARQNPSFAELETRLQRIIVANRQAAIDASTAEFDLEYARADGTVANTWMGENAILEITSDAVLLTAEDKPTRRIPHGAISDVALKEESAFSFGWLQLAIDGEHPSEFELNASTVELKHHFLSL